MRVYCICCELSDGMALRASENVACIRDILPPVTDVLSALGSSIQISRTAWLLASELPAGAIMERLFSQVIAESERILVLPVDSAADWRCHSGSVDSEILTWLGKYLPD